MPDSARPLALVEHPVASPYRKDYDLIPGEGPSSWARQFDIANLGCFAARIDGLRVGSAVIAVDTPGVGLGPLLDIRISPAMRGQQVGSRLFAAACEWAAARGCMSLEIETQNTNVAACHFYARNGCVLNSVTGGTYPLFPLELRLIWAKSLMPGNPSGT